jgi:hypothetical protein
VARYALHTERAAAPCLLHTIYMHAWRLLLSCSALALLRALGWALLHVDAAHITAAPAAAFPYNRAYTPPRNGARHAWEASWPWRRHAAHKPKFLMMD